MGKPFKNIENRDLRIKKIFQIFTFNTLSIYI